MTRLLPVKLRKKRNTKKRLCLWALRCLGSSVVAMMTLAQGQGCLNQMGDAYGYAYGGVYMLREEVFSLPQSNSTSTSSIPDAQLASSSAPTPSPNFRPHQVIFYNVFIPETIDETGDKTRIIIREQLGQVGTSGSETTDVYYNTVGKPLDHTIMTTICQENGLRCHHLAHYEEAYEFETLQAIQGYCSSRSIARPSTGNSTSSGNANDNGTIVTYLHNKGSFHPSTGNDHWRRSMTSAVTSRQCYEGLTSTSTDTDTPTCNACGLVFEAVRFPFYPGNMFTAHCSYIAKLLDPIEFREKSNAITQDLLLQQARGVLSFHILPSKPSFLGLDRYAAEAWIGSHPAIRPCDVGGDQDTKVYQDRTANPDEFDLQPAPRRTLGQVIRSMGSQMPRFFGQRRREYFLLPGYLQRWYYFYNEPPPSNSWLWKYFPDGQFWINATTHHGSDAVHEVTKDLAII